MNILHTNKKPVCDCLGRWFICFTMMLLTYSSVAYSQTHLTATRKMNFSDYVTDFCSLASTNPKKAVKIMKKINSRKGNYQLAHYYLFGAFDLHACSHQYAPINYAETQTIDEKRGLKYLQVSDPWFASMLYANKDCKYYNPMQALICMVQVEETSETDSIITLFLQQEIDLEFDLRLMAQSYYKEQLYHEKDKKNPLKVWNTYERLYVLDNICRIRNLMPPTHHSAIRNLKNHPASELFLAGLSCRKKGQYDQALYFYRLAAVSGHLDAFKATHKLNESLVLDRSLTAPGKLSELKWFQTCENLACISSDITFKKMYPEEFKEIKTYWWGLHNKYGDIYFAEKEAKKQARREKFANIMSGIGQGLMMATAATYNSIYAYNSPYSYSGIINTDALLNPSYGIMQIYYPSISNGVVSQSDYNVASSFVKNAMDAKMTEFRQQWESTPVCFQMDWSNVNWNTTYNNIPLSTTTNYGGTSAENVTGSSTTNIASSHTCSYCKGKGRVAHETNPPLYGTANTNEYCSECGGSFPRSWGHCHITCPVCHGR